MRDRHSGNLCPYCTDPPALLLELPAQLAAFQASQPSAAAFSTEMPAARHTPAPPGHSTGSPAKPHLASGSLDAASENTKQQQDERSRQETSEQPQEIILTAACGTAGDREGREGEKIPARSSSLSLRCVASIVQLQPQHASSNSNNALRRGLCSFIRFLPPS